MANFKDTTINGFLEIKGNKVDGDKKIALQLPENTYIYIGNEEFSPGIKNVDWNNDFKEETKPPIWQGSGDNAIVQNSNNNEASGDFSHAEGYGCHAYGIASHAEGAEYNSTNTDAIGQASHAEGAGTGAIADGSHSEGVSTEAGRYSTQEEALEVNSNGYQNIVQDALDLGLITKADVSNLTPKIVTGLVTKLMGYGAHSEGSQTKALGSSSHAEGNATEALSNASHSEGDTTVAWGEASHAEGHKTRATGNQSHAEGFQTIAIGNASHAEGKESKANGYTAHAEGLNTAANGLASHSEGTETIAASQNQHAQGKFNIYQDNDEKPLNYAHIVGNGSSNTARSNAHTLDWQGNAWYQGKIESNGEDYAEFFEWLDGNPDNEDRVGLLVTLDGEKIKLANTDDEVLGVISGTVAVLGGTYECEWNGKYLTDDFGRVIYDMVEEFIDVEHIEFKEVEKEVIDEETNETRTEIELEEVKTVEKQSLGFWKHPRINPDYDPEQAYINRSDRPEWDVVGMLGKLYVRDDGTCIPNYYATIGENGIATSSLEKTNIRILSRINSNVVRVLLK